MLMKVSTEPPFTQFCLRHCRERLKSLFKGKGLRLPPPCPPSVHAQSSPTLIIADHLTAWMWGGKDMGASGVPLSGLAIFLPALIIHQALCEGMDVSATPENFVQKSKLKQDSSSSSRAHQETCSTGALPLLPLTVCSVTPAESVSCFWFGL